jgi:c-di-GMP-binding flagellar brake protein YcgR
MSSTMKALVEKRKTPRVLMYLPLEYRVMNLPHAHKGQVVDASEGGFQIDSPRAMPMGARLNLALRFPKGYESNNFKAVTEIVWTSSPETGADGYRYGLRIVAIQEEDERNLRKLLAGRLKREEPGSRPGFVNFEMRRYPRYAIDLPIEYWRVNSPVGHTGRTVNASEGGLMLYLSDQVEIGHHLRLLVMIRSDANFETIQMLGQVVWMDIQWDGRGGDYRCGVKILEIAPEDLKRLRDYIQNLPG